MKRLALTFVPLMAASPAFAHLDPAAHGSFAAGLTHPVFGADHILAMVAVGLWAVVLGGRALWSLPAAFVVAMAAGFALALAGLPLPMVEPMILASVLVLGVLAALATRLPLGGAVSVVAALAVFHGHAHGAEMGGASALTYMIGFAAATALLHATGLGAGIGLARLRGLWLTRLSGAAVALAGSALLIAS